MKTAQPIDMLQPPLKVDSEARTAKRRRLIRVSIRKKIVLAFIALVLIGWAIGYLSYYQSHVLNQKLRLVEMKENLFNSILEARRYEKNFLLTFHSEYLQQALFYAHQSKDILETILKRYHRFTLAKNLETRLDDLGAYEKALTNLLGFQGIVFSNETKIGKDYLRYKELIEEVGRNITTDMETMISDERYYIKKLIAKSQLLQFVDGAALFLASALAALSMIFLVDRPLKTIEDAIQKIAQGDYENIPEIATGDEFEGLVVSLNRMIRELNRRSEQLLQTEKLASLGTLTSGVAHELNNPLNNISTSVQILLEELEEPDLEYKKELLVETEKQVVRARDTVRALLEFSRERSFSLEEVDFRKLVDDTVKLLKSELPVDVELKVDVPQGIRGRMDPRRMQQVLLNLIINGVQAMEDGGLLVISASVHESEGLFGIQVRDTGYGIPEENIAKIFDPFFTTKDTGAYSASGDSFCQGIVEQRGSGLGLAICHGIVEKHGGHIEVESELGKGTTFRISMPLGERDDRKSPEK